MLQSQGITTWNGTQVTAGTEWRESWSTKARCSRLYILYFFTFFSDGCPQFDCVGHRCVIPILSPAFFRSTACKDELTWAYNLGLLFVQMPQLAAECSVAGIPILPVRAEPFTEPLPWRPNPIANATPPECPDNCAMILQNKNRIPGRGHFDDHFEVEWEESKFKLTIDLFAGE